MLDFQTLNANVGELHSGAGWYNQLSKRYVCIHKLIINNFY